jgi:translation initiation factor IF-2
MTVEARGAGGRDAEVGAAERRLAEALRAQASLGARPTTPAGGAPQIPARVGRPGKVPAGKAGPGKPAATAPPAPVPSTTKAHPPKAAAPKGQLPAKGPKRPVTAPPGGAQPGHGKPASPASGHVRGGQAGPQHTPARGVHGSGGQRDREQPTQVSTVDPGLAGAPTTQQPTTQQPPGHGAPTPAGPRGSSASAKPGAAADRPGSGPAALRVRWALLACLLAGLLLGCLLAMLSVLDPGLLPALG